MWVSGAGESNRENWENSNKTILKIYKENVSGNRRLEYYHVILRRQYACMVVG